MAVPYTFATQTTSIPLAELDTNFSTPITIGTTVIPLGNVAPILENVTLGNVVIASGNVTLTNVNVINATITQATITTANVTTANITSAFITTANVTTANITTANVVTIRATTANIATANVTAMEAVSANVTTIRSTTANLTTANVTTAFITTANIATANVVTIIATTANIATANVTTLIVSAINVATANVTTIITAGITDSGNLTFTGTGNRITGDFSNATLASRVIFQTSTANAQTSIISIPNGTITTGLGTSVFSAEDSTSIATGSGANTQMSTLQGTESRFGSGIRGAGTYLPMTFYTGGSEKVRIDTSGNVGIGTVPSYKLDISGTSVGSSVWAHIVNTDTTAGATSGYFASNGAINVVMYSSSAAGYGILGTTTNHPVALVTNNTERMRIDSVGNAYVETGNLWQYSPAPTSLAAGANAGTAAQLLGGMFSAAQTTAVTLTMPTGTAIDTGFSGVPAVDIGFYFYVINTGSALGAVTVAVNTNVTSLGSLVVAIGTSAQFRLRRTAANTYVMYRLS